MCIRDRAAAVERQRGLLDLVVGGGRACREEASADPAHQVLAGHIVGADDDHAAATTGADPILGQRHALRGAGAVSYTHLDVYKRQLLGHHVEHLVCHRVGSRQL